MFVLQGMCDDIIAMSQTDIDNLKVKVSKVTNLPEVSCFVYAFENFANVSTVNFNCMNFIEMKN